MFHIISKLLFIDLSVLWGSKKRVWSLKILLDQEFDVDWKQAQTSPVHRERGKKKKKKGKKEKKKK